MRVLLFFLAVLCICSSQALLTPLSSLTLLTTPLPVYFGVNESIRGLELRLYLAANDADAVRVTPTCPGVVFAPSPALFNATVSIASGLVATATTTGSFTVNYVATVEGGSAAGVVLASQSITVLPVPTAYGVGDSAWSGVILQRDSFDAVNSSTPTSSFWSDQKHGFSSSACGSFDGNNALFFTSLGDRLALTAPLGLTGFHGIMHFYHLYGFQAVQKYDVQGDNRVACEKTDVGEEVVFGYLPNGADPRNISSWMQILEIPVPVSNTSTFTPYSIILPGIAMHQATQFYWMQKNHSSFPIDTAVGLTGADVIAAENDPTGVRGQLGVQERELWTYRNLFDQWAIDNVRLEVRLNVPTFSIVANSNLNSTSGVGIGEINIQVASPVPGSWVKFISGDGTQDFPICDGSTASNSSSEVAPLLESGYVHAVACLLVNGSLISSYPVRSPRFLVQAIKPSISSSVDTSASVDTWQINLQCANCALMRYIVVPLAGDSTGSSFVPSCAFGNLVSGSTGSVPVAFNAKLRVVACGTDLLPSQLVESENFNVQPRSPTFRFITPATTITGFMNLTIVLPVAGIGQQLGIVYSIQSVNPDTPTCNRTLSSGDIDLVVKVFEVVRAVTCCVGVVCADSAIATWGPMDVKAITPTYSTVCSAIKPLTSVVTLAPVTTGASVRYQVQTGVAQPALTCSTGNLYTSPVEVSMGTTSLTAASCLDGLKISDPAVVAVALDNCCSGRSSYLHSSCSQVLLLNDTFAQCPGNGGVGNVQTNTNWQAVTSQWGGDDVNGGVHSDNVRCVVDTGLKKSVLQLTANGDLYSGVAPVGKAMKSDGTTRDRTSDDQFLEWALDGVSPLPCSPLSRCPARRVGAAVKSVLQQNSGVVIMRIKPCSTFGTLTQVWWGSYEDAVSNQNTTIPFLPLWKSALYQAKTTPSMPFILTSPASQNATGYTEVAMQWNASAARTNLYVDGQLVLKQMDTTTASTAAKSLSIGVWFPDAVAGEPLFPSCQVYVDQVQIFDLQIAGDRWCDYENVAINSIPCKVDVECLDWVRNHCFMNIYEAVCTHHRSYDSDDDNSQANNSTSSIPSKKFCQFRLQPTAQTSISSTAMSARGMALQWDEEEAGIVQETA